MPYLILAAAVGAVLYLWWRFQSERRPQRVRKIVSLRPETTFENAQRLVDALGGTFIRTLPLINAVVCELPADMEVTLLTADTNILRVDDDIEIHAIKCGWCRPWWLKRNQPKQQLPWGVRKIGADKVWGKTTGRNVKVAVIDTGVDYRHPDLARVVKGGYNALGTRSYRDDNGHGTHVAGVISANNNDLGVVGVAPDADVYAVKVLDKRGGGNLSDLVDGLQWCIEQEMDVVNMSLGAPRGNETLRQVIEKCDSAGICMIAAAGNEGPGRNTVGYPAKYPSVLAVAACDENGNVPSFSSRGPEVNVAAPGVDINSTWLSGNYRTLNGTSMASPHVAALAALLLAAAPGLTPDEIRRILIETADPLSGASHSSQGEGLVNASRALARALEKKRQ